MFPKSMAFFNEITVLHWIWKEYQDTAYNQLGLFQLKINSTWFMEQRLKFRSPVLLEYDRKIMPEKISFKLNNYYNIKFLNDSFQTVMHEF